MAYPHLAQNTAAVVAAIQAANAVAPTDAINNALSGLATGTPTPVGTPVLLWGVLVVCTTGYPSTPAFSYDATTIA